MRAEGKSDPQSSAEQPDRIGSKLLAALVAACLLAAFFLGYRTVRYESFHKFNKKTQPSEAVAPRPGGQAAVSLVRAPTRNGVSPEFLSTTIMPGLGMQILQITAAFPSRGEIDLLNSSSLEEVAEDAKSHGRIGAAFLVYLADSGHPSPSAADALTLQAADSSENHGTLDGANMTTVFNAPAQSLPGGLPAGIELRTSIVMSGRSIDMSITANNKGKQAVPLRLGCFPHLAIPSGQRDQARLLIPSTDKSSGAAAEDFSMPGGRPLKSSTLDATFTHLRRAFMGDGPEIELEDPASGYALRITAISSSIRSLRVLAPANGPWVVIAPIAEPEADLAEGERDRGDIPLLAPGESLQFRIRLQIVPLATSIK
ncbi:hypothetical protein [Terriglobus saanensis]|uniref:Uncharacterized protein n=1 Tax=Terriglobus saanensis (strain ATCC BAA-1853 / DSM 23119 / SP1PR4) TaxID=401053 RepID=E8V8B4_TERSS|nr:hypothetical protein [Terriglobus saanensis]ADV81817.1 hypothetical protein AciPR4_0984 [Terriglobus saanensis SP1PR4]